MIDRRGFIASVALAPLMAAGQAAALPDLMFDAHVHLVSKDLAHYPQVEGGPGGAPGALPGSGGVGTASSSAPGARVSAGRPRPIPTAEDVLGWMAAQGVAQIAAVQKRGTYGTDNRYILDSADAHANKFAPVVVLDATDPATPALLRGWVRSHGVAGVRLTGVRLTGPRAADGTYPWLESDQAMKVWQVAADTGILLDLMYTPPGYAQDALEMILRLAEKFPGVRVVLDHLGWPKVAGAPGYGMDEMYTRIAAHQNIRHKFTTINLDILEEANIPAPAFLAAAVAKIGADRIMWGSDLGNSAGSYDQMVARILAATAELSPSDRRKILHDSGHATYVRGGVRA